MEGIVIVLGDGDVRKVGYDDGIAILNLNCKVFVPNGKLVEGDIIIKKQNLILFRL